MEQIAGLAKTLDSLEANKLRPCRPLAKPAKTRDLAERELPWAEQQRCMVGPCRAEREKPNPPAEQ